MKIFSVIYWLSKEEIPLLKFNYLLLLLESLGLEGIKDFSTSLSFVVRNIVMELSEVIKSNLVIKIQKSEAFAVLTEATDIFNGQQLLTFTRYYDSEKNVRDTCVVNTSYLLSESEKTAPDPQSIYLNLKNLIVNGVSLDFSYFQAFCTDSASVLTRRNGGTAAKFQKEEQCENILNIHCICHQLALTCSDTRDRLKFVNLIKILN